jgi:hypothetical protein
VCNPRQKSKCRFCELRRPRLPLCGDKQASPGARLALAPDESEEPDLQLPSLLLREGLRASPAVRLTRPSFVRRRRVGQVAGDACSALGAGADWVLSVTDGVRIVRH